MSDLVFHAVDELIDPGICQISPRCQQHFSELFFAVDATRVPDVPERSGNGSLLIDFAMQFDLCRLTCDYLDLFISEFETSRALGSPATCGAEMLSA